MGHIQDVTTKLIEDYRLRLIEHGMKDSSVDVYMRAVAGLFKYLESKQRIFANPFDGVEPFTGQPKLDPALKTGEVDFATGAGNLRPVKLTGAEWVHPGIGHIGHYNCNCENVTFDVDEFGRVFFPDTPMYQVRVIDTAGNAITTIGGYGNADNCGPESAVIDAKTGQPRPRRADDPKDLKSPFVEPDIAMCWPTGVGVTDRHLYVADSISRRLVRGRVVYAAEESCPIGP